MALLKPEPTVSGTHTFDLPEVMGSGQQIVAKIRATTRWGSVVESVSASLTLPEDTTPPTFAAAATATGTCTKTGAGVQCRVAATFNVEDDRSGIRKMEWALGRREQTPANSLVWSTSSFTCTSGLKPRCTALEAPLAVTVGRRRTRPSPASSFCGHEMPPRPDPGQLTPAQREATRTLPFTIVAQQDETAPDVSPIMATYVAPAQAGQAGTYRVRVPYVHRRESGIRSVTLTCTGCPSPVPPSQVFSPVVAGRLDMLTFNVPADSLYGVRPVAAGFTVRAQNGQGASSAVTASIEHEGITAPPTFVEAPVLTYDQATRVVQVRLGRVESASGLQRIQYMLQFNGTNPVEYTVLPGRIAELIEVRVPVHPNAGYETFVLRVVALARNTKTVMRTLTMSVVPPPLATATPVWVPVTGGVVPSTALRSRTTRASTCAGRRTRARCIRAATAAGRAGSAWAAPNGS